MTRNLTNENIESAIREMEKYFEANAADHAYTVRMRLAVEEMLLTYRDRFGEETAFTVATGGLFRSRRFEIHVLCDELDPSGEEGGNPILRNMLTRNDLAPSWNYVHGYNRIVCSFHKKRAISGNMWLLLAVLAAIGLGLIAKGHPEGVLGNLCETFVAPVSNAIMRLLRFFASFVILWNVMLGICGMGDIATFSTVGRKTVRRFLGTLLAFTLGGVVFFLIRTPFSGDAQQAFEFEPIVTMILDIIPADPFSPFINGNTLQLLFLAFVLGIVLLILKPRIGRTLFDGVQDLSEVSDFILSSVVTLMPLVVFSSLFDLILNNDPRTVLGALEYPVTVLGLGFAAMLILFVTVCVSRKVSPRLLLKKLWPVMQGSLATASSSAVYLKAADTCEQKLGVDSRLTRIGLPIGPMLMGVSNPLLLMTIVFMGIRWYGLPLNLPILISIVISCFLLGIAAPPIPGGMTAVYLIVFTSFGIPQEMMAIVLAMDAILDHFNTMVNESTLLLVLTRISASLGMLDEDVLRKAE